MSTQVNLLGNKIYFGPITYDEYYNLLEEYPGWTISTVLNEITQKHDLVITYHESETVSQVKQTLLASIDP